MSPKKVFEIDGELLPTMSFDSLEQEESVKDDSLSVEELQKRAEDLRLKADRGSIVADIFHAIVNIGTAIDEARNDNSKLRQILSEFDRKAKSGDVAAQYKLGTLYLEGNSPIEKDEVKGLDYLLSAAKAGFKGAQAKVGRHYMYVTKQRSKALPYLYAAAIQGNEDANLLLGINYKEGIPGVLEQDPIETLRYLKRATIETLPNSKTWERGVAASILGEIYRDGDGVRSDPSEAIKWFRLALKNGAEVKTDLANLLKSQGDPSAKQEADNLIAAAANEGNKEAQALLADEKWDKELSAITIGGKKICFWLVQGKVLESEIKSQQHIRSANYGTAGTSVYSVTDSWKVLHFEKRNGDHVKLNLPDDAEKVVFSTGERIAVLYAGLDDGTGNATGYPYMIYCLDKKKIIQMRKIAEFFKDCGISPKKLFSGKLVWPLAAITSFITGSFIGILAAAGFGYLAYKSYKSGGVNSTKLAGDHFDRIENWVYANLI